MHLVADARATATALIDQWMLYILDRYAKYVSIGWFVAVARVLPGAGSVKP
jgi:hypothetical protein